MSEHEHDSTIQLDSYFERADLVLEAAKTAGIDTESGQNMYSAARDIYNVGIEDQVTEGNIEQAAGLARIVREKFKVAGHLDITAFFEEKTEDLYGRVEDIYKGQIKKYQKAGQPDMAAQVAHNAAKLLRNAERLETAQEFEDIAKTYLEMCETFYREDANPS